MPIYEYICTACDHRADILQGLNDPVPAFCLSCGREGAMRKLFAPPTIHYRGSGWAKKDRGSASRTKAPGASSGGDASGGASGDGDSSGAASGDGASPKGGSSSSDAVASKRDTAATPAPAKGD